MSYVIRNLHPSVIHIPDARLRLNAGQTAVMETLTPQIETLLVNRTLEIMASNSDSPEAIMPVDGECIASEVTEPAMPAIAEKKNRKSVTATKSEQSDDAQ